MTTLSEAFASFRVGQSKNSAGLKDGASPHETFIHNDVVPMLIQLQKETRGRKFREIQTTMQEAVTKLLSFQSEDWPPSPDDATATTAASTDAEETTSNDNAVTPIASLDDDPQTREPVHHAVVATLEACMSVLSHPALTAKAGETAFDLICMLIMRRYVSGRAGVGQEGDSDQQPSLLHRLLESVSKCCDSSLEILQSSTVKTLRIIVTSPKCGIHEGSILLSLRTVFHVYLVTKSANGKETAKISMLDMLRSVFFKMETFHAMNRSAQSPKRTEEKEEHTETSEGSSASFPSQYHADCYTVFRSLCKLSSKELEVENSIEPSSSRPTLINWNSAPSDPLSLSSKILALELIHASLNFCGDAFCQGEKFVYLVRTYLCGSLLKNCTSHHTKVAFQSQQIFLVLILKYKSYLKQEIEVFLSNVFLRVLDSQNSTFKQKALLLESLRRLCGDPVLLTQIFLHYDCDFDAMNLYKDILHMLTKLGGKVTSVGPSQSVSKKDAEEDFELSLAGMEVLITILKAFLRAQGLPVGDSEGDDSAGSKIRGMLQLDVGLAAQKRSTKSEISSVDDMSMASSVDTSDVVFVQRNAGASGNTDVAERIVDAFEMKRNAEQNFETGSVQFTLSLKTGLNFFIENGFAECDAEQVALFFLANKDKLDKTQMGEALGREPDSAFRKAATDPESGGPGFWVRLLHHYVEAQNFTDLMFDDAIRNFLSGFRLPGEAQKIDRIMEKFAERFTFQNPTVFPSADTAFILAFSVIMLNTDLHNPSIKPERRMTLESFIKNNRGIGKDGGDLPEKFLTGIFNRIKERPFSLKEDDAARERAAAPKSAFEAASFFEGNSFFGTTSEERKRENFKKERDEMVAITEQLARRRPDKSESTQDSKSFTAAGSIAPADVVKPMFDVTWGPMIGILSQVLECSDDDRSVAVCLNGFVYAVRVASRSQMTLARDTFISSLAKFTYLGSLKEMKRKNVECIRTLLSIAVIDGEYLGESWGPVLQCISQLARLRLSASGLDSDESFLVEQNQKLQSSAPRKTLFRQTNRVDNAKEAEENNGRAVLEAVQEVLLDKVFSSTVKLSAKSLAHFIEQLIDISSAEISGNRISAKKEMKGSLSVSRTGKDGPSIFSLQKLVEVADFNMDVRPRLVWAQVWELMADYFAQNACHENAMVSVFAIDSLKQLSFKFLDKPELAEFNFQRLFLNPFLVVMESKRSRDDVRELVLRCIDNMIRTKSHNLRSGWKVVFSILTVSANDSNEKIEFLGIAILQRLLDEHLDEVCSISKTSTTNEATRNVLNGDDFVNLCKTSLAFVQTENSQSPRPLGLSMRALCHSAIYADLLAAGRIALPEIGSLSQTTDSNLPLYTYDTLADEEQLEMTLWRPLLEGLANTLRSSVKSNAGGLGCLLPRASLLAIRSILLRHGSGFSTPQLHAIFSQTIIPAMLVAVEKDSSPVVGIVSESPAVSSIDFLVDAPPLPPPIDDPDLKVFGQASENPSRSMGPAELMLEASFTDLRHGGDGDLRRAHILAQKADVEGSRLQDQPFPDSWIASTAPSAIGCLIDVASELVFHLPEKEMRLMWSIITKPLAQWCTGNGNSTGWTPCEALIRMVSNSLVVLASRALVSKHPTVAVTAIGELYANLFRQCTDTQKHLHKSLEKAKSLSQPAMLDEDDAIVTTSFGVGRVVGEKAWTRNGELVSVIEVVKLHFGASLYRPKPLGDVAGDKEPSIPVEVDVPPPYYSDSIPKMKVRSIASYCTVQSLSQVCDGLVANSGTESLHALVGFLDEVRLTAADAASNEVVTMAFEEALVSEWGNGEDSLEISNRLKLQHGSAVFYITQEAMATKTIVRMLSKLYLMSTQQSSGFIEAKLVCVATEALRKFLDSEEKDGYLVDPMTWQSSGERGGKLALYCTLFVPVVMEVLRTVLAIADDQFVAHKQEFFPFLCRLVRVQSEDIRVLVQDILAKQVGQMIGVE